MNREEAAEIVNGVLQSKHPSGKEEQETPEERAKKIAQARRDTLVRALGLKENE